MKRSLSKSERLKTKEEFTRVFNESEYRSGCNGARLMASRNGLSYSRFAVTQVRKYGNAVKRNYARRILKEIYRMRKHKIPAGFDIIVILYPGPFCYQDRDNQFVLLLRRAGFAK